MNVYDEYVYLMKKRYLIYLDLELSNHQGIIISARYSTLHKKIPPNKTVNLSN